jgi:hypothetical protein
MVPPRYGGSRATENLAPLCDHHYDDYGHMFVDLFFPPDWAKIHGADWKQVAKELKGQFEEVGADSMVHSLDELLNKRENSDPGNPFPYLHPEKD